MGLLACMIAFRLRSVSLNPTSRLRESDGRATVLIVIAPHPPGAVLPAGFDNACAWTRVARCHGQSWWVRVGL